MATLETLDFKLLLDDKQFDQQIKADIELAKKLNADLSTLLDAKSKLGKVSSVDIQATRAAAKLDEQRALANERIAREKAKTLQAEQRAMSERVRQVEQERRERLKTVRVMDQMLGKQKATNASIASGNRLLAEAGRSVAQYASLWGAAKLISSIVRVTGEFELQRTTLAAMLNDVQAAETIFSEIKELAVKSPFNFKELTSYAKQLAAYSIPVNELYETTKMLADVSAGVGVGMDRLVLAYGQIRSAAFLRGQEVRQLTEAGIPILEELRKQFVALGEEGITTADVFDKISARMVPFEMVEKVFKDMTSEGGKFYNMQEIQAETLRGKISNLADAYQIMFDEIGSRKSGLLKGTVDLLRSMAENYQKVGRAIWAVVAALGVYKGALAVANAYSRVAAFSATGATFSFKKLGGAIKVATMQTKAYIAIERMLATINPWAMLAAGIAAVGTALAAAGIQQKRFRDELAQIRNESDSFSTRLVDGFEKLADRLRRSTESTQERRDIIAQLNREYGSYLPNVLNEANALSEIATNQERITAAIRARAKEDARQKAVDKIEDRYGKNVSSYGSAIAKLVGENYDGVTKEIAQNFVKALRNAILAEENKEKAGNVVFEELFGKFFGSAEAYREMVGRLANGDSLLLSNSISKYTSALRGMSDEITELDEQLDATFGDIKYTSLAEKDAIDTVNAAYAERERQLKAIQKTVSESEYNEEARLLQIEKLEALKKALEDLNAAAGDQSFSDAIARVDEQLRALNAKDLSWLQKRVNPLVTGARVFDLRVKEDTKPAEYYDDLRKAYKDVVQEYKDAEAVVAKLNADKKKGVNIDDEVLQKATKLRDEYKNRKEVIENIAKTLGITVDDKLKKGGRKKSPEQEELETRIALLKKMQEAYEKLSPYVKETEMAATLRRLFSSADLKDINVEALNFRDLIAEAADKLENVFKDKDAAETVRQYLGTDAVGEEYKKLKDLADALKDAREAQKKFMEQMDNWVVGEGYEGKGFQFKLSKIIADFRRDLRKLEERRGDAIQSLEDAIAAREKANEKAGFSFAKQIPEDVYFQAKSVVDEWAKLNNVNLTDFKNQSVFALEEVADAIAKAKFDGLEDVMQRAADKAHLPLETFKVYVTNLINSISDEVQRAEIEKKFNAASENIMTSTAQKARELAKSLVDDGLKGLDTSNWSSKSIFEVKRIQAAIKGIRDNAASAEVVKMLENAGISAEDFSKELDDILLKLDAAAKERKIDIKMNNLRATIDSLGKIADVLNEIAEATGNSKISSMFNSVNEVISNLSSVGEKVAKGDYFGAAMEYMTNIVTTILKAVAAEARLQQQIRQTTAEMRKRNQEERLARGVESPWGTDSLQGFMNAVDEARKAAGNAYDDLGRLSEKFSRGLDNDTKGIATAVGTASGALIGLLVGTIVPGIGNAIGAAVGAAVGAISGAVTDTVTALNNTYSTLEELAESIDAPLLNATTGMFRSETLQAILDTYDDLDKASREPIEKLRDNALEYETALKSFADSFSEFFGRIADTISDNIVNAFKESGRAALEYKDIMSDVASELAKSVIQSYLLKTVFTDDLKESVADKVIHNDVKGTLDDINTAMTTVEAALPMWQEFLNGMKDYFNIDGGDSQGSLATGIKGITEDTANLLASYVNAMRADIAYGKKQREGMLLALQEVASHLPTLAEYLTKIEANTFNTALATQETLSTIRGILTTSGGETAMRVYVQ